MTALLWRDIESIGRLAVVMLWVVLITVGWVIVAGLFTFSPRDGVRLSTAGATSSTRDLAIRTGRGRGARDVQLRRLQPGVQHRARRFAIPAARCHARSSLSIFIVAGAVHGDEHRDPRTDSVAGSRPARGRWHRSSSRARFDDPALGRIAGLAMTGLILFVAAASLYATILGYSRVPFAAARDGDFFRGVRAGPSDQALSARVAGGDWRDLDTVLLLHARPAGELADPGADPAPVHLAVRGGDPAAALPTRHPAAVHDVALPVAGTRLAARCGSTSSSPARSRGSCFRSRSSAQR